MNHSIQTRRDFLRHAALPACAAWLTGENQAGAVDQLEERSGYRLRYILGSPMYGKALLAEVLPEVRKIGARHIDLWPLPHANHLEQVHELGADRVAEMLAGQEVELGVITRYDLRPATIHKGLPLLKRLGGRMLITGAGRGRGDSDKRRVESLLEMIKPSLEKAAEQGVVLGLENHASTLLHTPSSLRWFAEMNDSPHLGIALAPYHLPQESAKIAELILHLGSSLVFFQGWQHGMGCMRQLPKEQEMLQMPGLGPLDFRPIVAALRQIDYQGWTEIFMHPVPRGIPIRSTSAGVTEEILRARTYLDGCLDA
jgi:sugar phosphate isomerase/epimerase